ncbi:hypothetical protein DBT_1154 [Dissulfuribacter thermophilus]|uniref:Uncharacterized protein n=1 Tax=Dissulfuribacter thermophilus TaxID=1156395 RepID=A0A1B9F638_9BACT|nr:hypothetical protein DBT_1154 [Dissulfuribacter thermophilus]
MGLKWRSLGKNEAKKYKMTKFKDENLLGYSNKIREMNF